jgi:hypothetical protein
VPATINGSPTHALIVHAVAVLLPLALLGALALVIIPSARKAFGLFTLGVAFVACISVPLAFLSGSALRRRVDPSPLISRHVALAHQLLPLAALFGVCLAVFVVIDLLRRGRHEELNRVEAAAIRRWPAVRDYSRRHRLYAAHRAAAVLLVVAALATMVAVVRAGDSGAKAAWNGRLHSASHGPGH